jgi:hypothetical protein
MAASYKPYLAALALLLALAGSVGEAAPKSTAVRLDDFSQRLLDAHNRERQRLGIAGLAWSDQLAADAAMWSASLARRHAFEHARNTRGSGENLWMGSAGAYTPEQMIGGFIDEARYFRPGRFPNVSRTGNWADVGHYSQLIWADTRQVGCARAKGGGDEYLVCRYWPAGNVMGQKVP